MRSRSSTALLRTGKFEALTAPRVAANVNESPWQGVAVPKERRLNISTSLLPCALLVGCASVSYRPLPKPGENAAAVYFIRQRAEPTAWNLWIYLDGEKAASLSNDSYVAVGVPSGPHKILFDWPPLAAKVTLEVPVNIEPQTARYFLVSGRIALSGISSAYRGIIMNFDESLQLRELRESLGATMIQEMARPPARADTEAELDDPDNVSLRGCLSRRSAMARWFALPENHLAVLQVIESPRRLSAGPLGPGPRLVAGLALRRRRS